MAPFANVDRVQVASQALDVWLAVQEVGDDDCDELVVEVSEGSELSAGGSSQSDRRGTHGKLKLGKENPGKCKFQEKTTPVNQGMFQKAIPAAMGTTVVEPLVSVVVVQSKRFEGRPGTTEKLSPGGTVVIVEVTRYVAKGSKIVEVIGTGCALGAGASDDTVDPSGCNDDDGGNDGNMGL